MKQLTIAKAINAGLSRAMAENPKVMLMGEDIGSLGGVYRVTEGLKDRYGAHRVLDTPLGEAGIVGTAVGLAQRGYRPVCEIQFDGFTFPAFNQITTQLAKIHARPARFLRTRPTAGSGRPGYPHRPRCPCRGPRDSPRAPRAARRPRGPGSG